MKLQITKLSNMEGRTGRSVPNQHTLERFVHYGDADNLPMLTKSMRAFQSYGSIIAVVECGNVTLDENSWDYSRTTSKYRNQFLNETTKETQSKIDSGEYKLI